MFLNKLKSTELMLVLAFFVGFTTGCVDESKLNTETVNYTPEERPLGVIAGDNAEYELGSATTVSLSGRLVGTVTDQTILWTQTSGTPIEGVTDWTIPNLTFPMPNVDGIETFDFQIAGLLADGSPALDADGEPLIATTSITVFDPEILVFYEIENTEFAELISVGTFSSGDDGFLTGAIGSHTQDIVPGASVRFTIPMEQDSFFTLLARFGIPSAGYGSKNAIVSVNGVDTEIVINATGSFSNYRVGTIKLNAGDNIIEVGGGWNYYRLDSILMIPAAEPPAPLPVAGTLNNQNAIPEAVSLMEFLAANYGTATLSGQTEYPVKVDDGFPLTEFDKVVAATGDDAPAIVAFDLLDFSATRVSNGTDPVGLSEAMISEHQSKNVILSGLFHWNAPTGVDPENWSQGFYTENTTFDLAATLADPTGEDYAAMMADLVTITDELQKFEDANIPILWRPLHEAEGAWFWWGAAGSDALKELWILMYNYMVVERGLDNLIWIYTHTQSLSNDWYPGDQYVDIVGFDGYAEPTNDDDNPFNGQYTTLKNRHNGQKLVALTETGTIPDVSVMHEQNAWWSFFITWNSNIWTAGDDIGPDGAEAGSIDENYAFDGVINLADIPGGRTKVEAGLWEGFEVSTSSFEAQVNWAATPGIATSSNWSASGARSLSLAKDLSAETDPTGAMFQVYPEGGFDVSAVNLVKVSGNAINAGEGATVKLWVKYGDDWVWADGGAVTIVDGGVELEVDVSEYDWLAGLGFQYENIDATATSAEFFLDNVRLDDTLIYDFEPDGSGFEAQVNWTGVSGITVTDDWSASGNRALTLITDLSSHPEEATGAMFQVYPEGGFDVSAINTISVSGNAINAGAGTTVKLWVKYGDDWVWADGGSVTVVDGGVELEVDISTYDWLAGFGFQFEGIDATSTNAKFYLDNVRLDDTVIYDFEGTTEWEFQVNWAGASGLQLAQDWTAEGENSLAGVTQLVDGDDNIILQIYPAGGVALGDVTTLKLTAHAENAGSDVTAQLWAKDKEGVWRDEGEFDIEAGGVVLSVDISDLSELQGFGVRFQHADNSATESQYYIDNIIFENNAPSN